MSRADQLRQELGEFCARRIGHAVEIDNLVRLSGGASREMWSFTVRDGSEERRLVLRRAPGGSASGTARANEVDLLVAAAKAGVPVPPVVWQAEPGELGSGAFFMEHVDGETIARKILRDDEYAEARGVMAGQCGEIIAKVHAMPADGLDLAVPAENAVEGVLDQYATLLDSFNEPHPAFELAMRWLRTRMPEPAPHVVVHGDFRIGNMIVGPEGVRSLLDWELAHMGDPWEDLAWICMRSWRFGGPGEVGGFGDREEFYAAYERTSGRAVDRDAVHWWEVMSNVKWGVMTIGQAFTHLWGHVRSMELGAIGRRTVETEYDVLRLLGAS